MMTYQELETKLQTQQTQIDNQQTHIDNLLRITHCLTDLNATLMTRVDQLERTVVELINETRANGSYITGQIASKDGR